MVATSPDAPAWYRRDVERRLAAWHARPHMRLVRIWWRQHGTLPEGPLPGCGCPSCTGLPAIPRAARSGQWRGLGHRRLDVEAARRVPILDVVRRLGLGEPRRLGRDWRVRCPFHDDTHPSLSIDAGRRLWFCHPCGFGGDMIKLVILSRRVSFADAVRWLGGGR